jgi:hypothetical protein
MSAQPPIPPPQEPSSPSEIAPRPGASSARKSGSGRGCLVSCLGVAVVLVLAVVVGLVVARDALEARWKQWQAENPEAAKLVVGALPVVKEMVGGLASKEEAADTAAGKREPPKRLEGINDKRAMPADLPVWPRAKAETYNVGQGHAAGYQRVRAPSDSVLRFYRKAMPEHGWKLTTEQEGAGGVLLLYQKSGRTARVEVVADTGQTEIWLRSRVPEKPKKK